MFNRLLGLREANPKSSGPGMSEVEDVWCVWDCKLYHATASGNAPLSSRSAVACLCPHTAYGSHWSGGGYNYRPEIRLPTCPECLDILRRRQRRARGGKWRSYTQAIAEDDKKQRELFET